MKLSHIRLVLADLLVHLLSGPNRLFHIDLQIAQLVHNITLFQFLIAVFDCI